MAPFPDKAADGDWPAPADVVNEAGSSDIVLLCEHASRHVPMGLRKLGLEDADLARHIAWDIGAGPLARRLAVALDAPAFLGAYSRLVIDLNRPLTSKASIPERSEATDIPGNIALTDADRRRRVDLIFKPYHDRIASCLAERERRGRTTHIVSIHSFTPVFLGMTRPWHAGVLFNRSIEKGKALVRVLADGGGLTIGVNQPYFIQRTDDYGVPIHGEDRGHEALLIEVRQDLVADEQGVDEWTDRLARALREVFAS